MALDGLPARECPTRQPGHPPDLRSVRPEIGVRGEYGAVPGVRAPHQLARDRACLDVIGGESIHRVTAAAFAATRPGIWPGGLHLAPTASAGCAAMRAPRARPWLRTRPAGMR